jgi:hypothetical protein
MTIKAKKDLKGALGNSLKSEEKAIKGKYDKFSQADAIFDEYEKRNIQNRESNIEEMSSTVHSRKSIRDSFTMPVEDHKIINKIIEKFLDTRNVVNKSEVVRMALHTLYQLPTEQLIKAYRSIEKVKIGRPK